MTSAGILEAIGAQTIRTSTGNLTLATAAGNGNIILAPNGSGRTASASGLVLGSTSDALLGDSLLEVKTGVVAGGLTKQYFKVRTFESSAESYIGIAPSQITYYRNTSTGVNLIFNTSVLNASGGGHIVFSPNIVGTDHTPTETVRF